MKEKTLSQRINELVNQGYSIDFNLMDNKIEDSKTKTDYLPENFKVDKVYRFEGMSNPSDNSILYAITTSDNKKGLLVDGYGVSGGEISKELREKLKR